MRPVDTKHGIFTEGQNKRKYNLWNRINTKHSDTPKPCFNIKTVSLGMVISVIKIRLNSPHKSQWRRALMCSLICVWLNGWVNNREAGDFRRYRTHYDVTVMILTCIPGLPAYTASEMSFWRKFPTDQWRKFRQNDDISVLMYHRIYTRSHTYVLWKSLDIHKLHVLYTEVIFKAYIIIDSHNQGVLCECIDKYICWFVGCI